MGHLVVPVSCIYRGSTERIGGRTIGETDERGRILAERTDEHLHHDTPTLYRRRRVNVDVVADVHCQKIQGPPNLLQGDYRGLWYTNAIDDNVLYRRYIRRVKAYIMYSPT